MAQTLNYQTPPHPRIPAALKAVAWLFIGFGILSAVNILAALINGNVSLNLGVLGIFIGRGLLRLRSGWRTFGLVFLWIALVSVPLLVAVTLAFAGASPAKFRVNGRVVGTAPSWVMLIGAGLAWGLSFWQYRVLVRPNVRALFLKRARA